MQNNKLSFMGKTVWSAGQTHRGYMKMRSIYKALAANLEERSHLSGVMGILHWDQEVIMPPGAEEARARQISALAGVLHQKATDPEIGGWLAKLEQDNLSGFNELEICNIREARRDYDRETKVPGELVRELAELGSRAHGVWVKARKDNRFADFVPVLKRFVALKKQWAHYIEPQQAPYDVCIDSYERDATMAQIDPLFARLKSELVPLIRAVQSATYRPEASFLEGPFDVEKQKDLARRISRDIGFSFDHGRMDVSVHPFCGGSHPTDVRITTRYRTDDFVESLYAVIHETGHGLYEQGRMAEARDLPVSEPLTMGIHESQSLFWERMVAQRKSFCAHYLDLFASTFPDKLQGVSAQALYEAINICRPSLIRVEADEVTYPLHVILRYEIEKSLFAGDVEVEQLPELWNDKMQEYLGIRPATDAEGILQDIHWSMGAFGYFPSYTLGAMTACQFFNALKKDVPDVDEKIEHGEFAGIKSWLNENIHNKGRLYSSAELLRRVTGETLNADHFIRHLNEKYRAIYRLESGGE